jgi:hypothetical protein
MLTVKDSEFHKITNMVINYKSKNRGKNNLVQNRSVIAN